jgi:NRAMP (natural resistance-associated macrophage protein)-like metal ion transporter
MQEPRRRSNKAGDRESSPHGVEEPLEGAMADLRSDPILALLNRLATKPLHKDVQTSGNGRAGRPTFPEAVREGPRGLLRILGPGIVTGAADDDPSAIATYSQAGAQAGYGMLWTGVVGVPMMISVQELAQRIALQTGAGLVVNLRRKFPPWIVAAAVALLVVSNIIVLGADLQAVAVGGQLLSHGFLQASWLIVPIAVALVGFQLFGRYETLYKTFRWLTLALFAYVVAVFLVHPNALTVLAALFVPHVEFSNRFLLTLAAVLGTTLSPYLFIWQPAQEIDVMQAMGRRSIDRLPGVTDHELMAARTDTFVGMFFAQLVAFCIILTTAAVLNAHGTTDIRSAAAAAQALTPFGGPVASALFATGFVGTGLLAIPILSASSAYGINEVARVPGSLAVRPQFQPTFYGIIVAATAIGVGMQLLHLNVIQALVVASALSGMAAVPLLVLMTLFGADRRYMAERVSGLLSRGLTWIGAGAMAAAAVALVVSPFVNAK